MTSGEFTKISDRTKVSIGIWALVTAAITFGAAMLTAGWYGASRLNSIDYRISELQGRMGEFTDKLEVVEEAVSTVEGKVDDVAAKQQEPPPKPKRRRPVE